MCNIIKATRYFLKIDYVNLKIYIVFIISRANTQKGTAKKTIQEINLSKKSYSIIKEATESILEKLEINSNMVGSASSTK